MKIDTPDGVRYFYTEKEIEAYRKKLTKEIKYRQDAHAKQQGTVTVTHSKSKKKVSFDDYRQRAASNDNKIHNARKRDADDQAWLDKYQRQLSALNKR